MGFFVTSTKVHTIHVTLQHRDKEYVTGVLDLRFLNIDKDLSEHMFDDMLNGLLLLSSTLLSGISF